MGEITFNDFIEYCEHCDIHWNIYHTDNYIRPESAEECIGTDRIPDHCIEIDLYKYSHRCETHINIKELFEEGYKFDTYLLGLAKDFNNFCEKVGE